MKRTAGFLSFVLAFALMFTLAVPASAVESAFEKVVPSPQTIICNGREIALEVYNIDGSNYFKLRDIAFLLNGTESRFSVGFDAETRVMTAVTGEAYEAVGGELATGEDKSASCVASTWTLEVDGESGAVSVYNLGGNNFFRLRDLGSAFHFAVDYDAAANAAVISSIDYYEANMAVFQAGGENFTIDQLKAARAVEGGYTDENSVRHTYRGARLSDLNGNLPDVDASILITTQDGRVNENDNTYTGAQWADAVVVYELDGDRIEDRYENYVFRIRLAIGGDMISFFSYADIDAVIFRMDGKEWTLSELRAMPAVQGKCVDGNGAEVSYRGVRISALTENLPAADMTVVVGTYDGTVNEKDNTYTGAQFADAVVAYECGGKAIADVVEAGGYRCCIRLVIGGDMIRCFSEIDFI